MCSQDDPQKFGQVMMTLLKLNNTSWNFGLEIVFYGRGLQTVEWMTDNRKVLWEMIEFLVFKVGLKVDQYGP